MKNLNFKILYLLSILVISCSNNDENGGINLVISASNSSASKLTSGIKTANAEVVFTDFKISMRDVVFKNDDDINSSLDTDEIQFRGPYQIDLLDNTDALSQTIGNAFVPDGKYKEMRFKFHKDEDLPASNDLFDKSIYIEGTIDGTPFVFWHDTSENLDVGRSTGVLVQGNTVNFTVQFNISQFLSSLNQIDLSQATDNNNDGLIEIFPNDEDGNQDIADALKDNIKMAADLLN
ncbi:DUF4382 domain-containing protein [Aestuariivivens sediminicola]|uniref:DUF4382 domain-containing protein n=1 Tax=Aestuariivivens sediminicola TaxID=2913560 RepID=UPI001F57E919|nr:DUF4382 domain-containing protein [Aestuariivivens sediminicola]